MIENFSELLKETKGKIGTDIPRLGVIWPTDRKYIEAVIDAIDQGLIKATLFGPVGAIQKLVDEADTDSFGSDSATVGFDLKDVDSPEKAAQLAMKMVSERELDFLLKGDIVTRDFINMLYDPETGLASKKDNITHIGVMQSDRYHKLMFITDGAVNCAPDAGKKIQILQNAASMVTKLGIETPKVALLAAVEAIYPAVPVTMEEAAIAKMNERGQIKGVLVDGPLSFDVAISKDVAHSKGINNSQVAGDTDIFMPPNMETANGVYKAMVMYAGLNAAAVIHGARVPIATASMVDSSRNIVNSITLGAFLAGN
jgi:phosphotransacetylase